MKIELDVRPPERRSNLARPPPSSIGPLTIERAWPRRGALLWLLVGVLLEVLAFRNAADFGPLLRFVLGTAGIAPLYAALCFAFNRTTVQVASGAVTVSAGPLPVSVRKRVALGDIQQLVVQTTTHSQRRYRWLGSRSPRDEVFRYHVVAELAGGDELKLLGGYEAVDEARRVERTLEAHIGITDDPTRSLTERR